MSDIGIDTGPTVSWTVERYVSLSELESLMGKAVMIARDLGLQDIEDMCEDIYDQLLVLDDLLSNEESNE